MNRKYRKTIIAGNWKMNMLASSVKPFIEELKANMPKSKTCDVVLCTPAVMIPAMVTSMPSRISGFSSAWARSSVVMVTRLLIVSATSSSGWLVRYTPSISYRAGK